MSPNTFFQASLLLPMVLPLLVWAFFPNMGTAIGLMSVMMAGAPYVVFAAYMFVKLARLPQLLEVPQLILMAPILFLAPAAVAFMIWSGMTSGFNRYLPVSLMVFIPFAFFILMFGYTYVGMTALVFKGFVRAGWVALKPV